MHATAPFAPIADRLLKRALTRSNTLPTPDDSSRQIASGPNADRVLIVGGGIASGFGVRKQELALPGRLAIALSAITGRGAIVDVASSPGLRIDATPDLLAGLRLEHYDAILLTLGTADSYGLMPAKRWRESLTRLLDLLDARIGQGTTVYLASAAPLPRLVDSNNPLLRVRDKHALRLDEATEGVVARRTGVVFATTAETGLTMRWNSTFDYDRLGRRLAPLLAERLDDLWSTAPAQSARRLRASSDPELLRQAALDRTGLIDSHSTPALERLLRGAAARMNVEIAAVVLIDGDSQRTKAVVGIESLDMPRSIALCNETIRGDTAHVEVDLRGLPAWDLGGRFYAGFPLESPDGYRIGAVCLIDRVEHAQDEVDDGELAELATRVQNELWAEIAGHPSPSLTTRSIEPELPRLPESHLRDHAAG